jgi:transketolase
VGKLAPILAALNPATPLEAVTHVLDLTDLLLVMTVNPGFGGQQYLAGMEPKIGREALTDKVDRLAITTLRFLAADAVQAANSGHPGLPLGASPAAWALWHPQLAADFALHRTPAARDIAVLTPLTDTAAGGRTATRQASGAALNALATVYPALVGGSADLASSTNTAIPGGDVSAGDYAGRTIHFGVREHAMAATLSGIALHGGLRPFGSTFLVFSDYLRPALRLSALMRQPVIYVFTHDSVYLGEDGPTHQPIEHVESLRLIPGLTVLRPADAAETALAWEIAATNTSGPTALILTRQNLPVLGGAGLDQMRDDGFRVVRGTADEADVVLAASGSEVSLALEVADLLAGRGVHSTVISVMWRERFEEALSTGRRSLGDAPVVWAEAGVPTGWRAIAGERDTVVGLNRFGESGPGPQVAAHLGLTPVAIANAAFGVLGRAASWR